MSQGVSANFAPHFAPSPAFVKLVQNNCDIRNNPAPESQKRAAEAPTED
jgi:hypothetical protein